MMKKRFQEKSAISKNTIAKKSLSTSHVHKVMFFFISLFLFTQFFFVFFVSALPPLPSEFYGAIYTRNDPASSGTITLRFANGSQCGPSFTIQNTGYFGLITCPGDDPETIAVEGHAFGETLTVYYNGEATAYISGDNVSAEGTFKFLNVSHPLPFCGDDFCDVFHESLSLCPEDCNVTIPPTNASGNNTGNNTNGTGGTGGSGGDTTSDGSPPTGGSGGGGGGGGGGALGGLFGALTGITGISNITGSQLCTEEWVCEEWGLCTISGFRERSCLDEGLCGTFENRPDLVEECDYIPSCYNLVQDFLETGVDCGGPCSPCASCTNGIQDCHTLENGTILCETGVDCGGACRSCDSCFNGIKDYTETGVDCGGIYCASCSRTPLLEFPSLICQKEVNPFLNGGVLFLIILLLLILVRIYFYLKKIHFLHVTESKDDYLRAKMYFAERRKLVLFLLIAFAVAILSYLYYYEFLLCDLEYGYLWWFALLLVLVPLIIYEIWRFIEYKDKERLRKLGMLSREHEIAMENMVRAENMQLIEIEQEIKKLIERIAKNESLKETLLSFSELRTIYKDIIRLYYEYSQNKNPFGIEKELCDQVYAIETSDSFLHLAEQYPDFSLLYSRLKLLYSHYESKQALYEEIEQERERLNKRREDVVLAQSAPASESLTKNTTNKEELIKDDAQ